MGDLRLGRRVRRADGAAGLPPVGPNLPGEQGYGALDPVGEPARAFALVGGHGGSEEHGDGGALQPAAVARPRPRAGGRERAFLGLLGQQVTRPVEVDRHDRAPGSPGQVGRSTPELLGPAVGGAAALGKDDQVPPFLEQLRRRIGRSAVHLASLNRDGRQRERPQCRLPGAVVEVVRRRRDDGAVAEPHREGREQQRGVEVAGVVGGEDHRALDAGEMLHPAHRRRSEHAGGRAGHVVHHHGPGQPDRVAPRPVVVVVESDTAFGIGTGHRRRPGGRAQREARRGEAATEPRGAHQCTSAIRIGGLCR